MISASKAVGLTLFDQLGADLITQLGKANAVWNTEMYHWAKTTAEGMENSVFGNAREIKSLTGFQRASQAAGNVSDQGSKEDVMKFSGNLTWFGGKLQLDGKLVAPAHSK